jgi:hypothetical protein
LRHILSLAISVIFLLTYFLQNIVFADVSPFPRVEISNLPNHWHLDPPSDKISWGYAFTSDDRALFYKVQPVNATECKIVRNHKIGFPSPHISSFSYSSDGKNLNSTLWLDGPFQTPLTNISNISQELYRIEISPAKFNLSESTKIDTSYLNNSLRHQNFTLISKPQSTTFGGSKKSIPAVRFVYEFAGKKHQDICIHCKAMRYLGLKDKLLYTISYVAEDKRYSAQLPYIVQKLVNQTEIGKVISSKESFQSYENPTYNIKAEIPNNWNISNSNPFSQPYTPIVSFLRFNTSHIKSTANDYPTIFTIFIDPYPGENPNLKSYLTKVAVEARSQFNNTSFKPLWNSTKSTLLGNPAYTLIYTHRVYVPQQVTYTVKTEQIGTIIGGDKIFRIRYTAKSENFNASDAANIVRHLETNPANFTYRSPTYNIKVQYPSDWIETTNRTFGNFKPDDIDSVSFYSPIRGPYSLLKSFDIALSYESAYGGLAEHGNVTVPYESRISWNATNRMWIKQINEYSLDGQEFKVLYPKTLGSDFNAGNGYIPLNLNLSSIRLPSQFYVYFYARDYYVKDGQYCSLYEKTHFVSVPPPTYSISIVPSSLYIRAGETQTAIVHLQSFQDIPFTAFFSIANKTTGVNTIFRPDRVSVNVPPETTTSYLDIKTTSDTSQQPYDLGVKAEIVLTPNANLNNSDSALIHKFSNVPLTITRPLDFGDQLSSAWNTFGSPINGFITVILAISTFVGGLLLKRHT